LVWFIEVLWHFQHANNGYIMPTVY